MGLRCAVARGACSRAFPSPFLALTIAFPVQILTGRLPFYNCPSDYQVMLNIGTGVIPARKDYPELPEDNKFWDILESCWKPDPEERPTMAELKDLICELHELFPEFPQRF